MKFDAADLYILRVALSAAGSFEVLAVAIWEAWCLYFDTLGGAILAPREHSEGPSEHQDGRDVMVAQDQNFSKVGTPVWEFLFAPRANILFLFGLVSRSFFCTDF